MRNELKTKEVDIPSLGRKIEIRELSWAQMIEVNSTLADNSMQAGLLLCKYGVSDFSGESLDVIGQNLSLTNVMEISKEVMVLSGTGKNSEGTLSESSLSDSH